jgi:hypothetical protein|tara:strand:+ start:133 stop:483 length:351 start_codon:yes stop_codon:yes gene_type:complete
MADVGITNTDRFTNTVEFTGNAMSSVGDWLQVHAHSSEFSFAANVTSSANFTLALEANFNGDGNWFTIDTSKTINAAGQYVYFYNGKPATLIRMRIASISSGTVAMTPHIVVAYHG